MNKVNTKSLRHFFIPALLILSIACEKSGTNPLTGNKEPCKFKDQICDSSQVTIINRTEDTLFYGVGISWWEDTLLPTKQCTLKYGRVKVTYDEDCVKNRQSWSTHEINSNFGYWAFNIDHCNKITAFEYTDTTKGRVELYDISEK